MYSGRPDQVHLVMPNQVQRTSQVRCTYYTLTQVRYTSSPSTHLASLNRVHLVMPNQVYSGRPDPVQRTSKVRCTYCTLTQVRYTFQDVVSWRASPQQARDFKEQNQQPGATRHAGSGATG